MRQLACRDRGHNGRMLLTDARVAVPDGMLDRGWVRVEGGRIAEVGAGPPPAQRESVELGGRHVVPGFVDLHVHGGGGHSMLSPAAAASLVPARVLGIDHDAGSIAPGKAADLVVLDEALEVEAVMIEGRWITSGRLFHT
jgi:N-acetylglucosamine-6-phosphate deacetylase